MNKTADISKKPKNQSKKAPKMENKRDDQDRLNSQVGDQGRLALDKASENGSVLRSDKSMILSFI